MALVSLRRSLALLACLLALTAGASQPAVTVAIAERPVHDNCPDEWTAGSAGEEEYPGVQCVPTLLVRLGESSNSPYILTIRGTLLDAGCPDGWAPVEGSVNPALTCLPDVLAASR